jgi:hypothetical protein
LASDEAADVGTGPWPRRGRRGRAPGGQDELPGELWEEYMLETNAVGERIDVDAL